MKKIFIFVGISLLIIMSLIFIIAQKTNVNIIEYSSDNLVVNIQNSLIGDVAEIKLISHESFDEQKFIIRGENRSVIIYEIENYGDNYKDAIEDLEIINMKNNKSEEKEYHLEYAIYDYVEKPIYTETCEEEYYVNLSSYCYKNITSFENVYEIVDWQDLNSRDIPKGNITIALVTDVLPGDHYDGVFTLFGKRIDKHAEWTESLNVNLVGYYKLDEITGTNAEDIFSTNDGTASNSRVFTTQTTGIINTGADFTGGNDIIDLGNSAYDFEIARDSFTFSMWVKTSTTGVTDRFFSKRDVDEQYAIYFHSGNTIRFESYDASDGKATNLNGANTFRDNQWHHVVITADTTTAIMYVDDNVEATDGVEGDPVSTVSTVIGTMGTQYFTGMIDEVGIWDRILTPDEVTQLWNSGAGISFTPPPTICSPAMDVDWVISDEQICDGVEKSIGTGELNIISGGTLILIGEANVTASEIILQTTGDQIFICAGCELRNI